MDCNYKYYKERRMYKQLITAIVIVYISNANAFGFNRYIKRVKVQKHPNVWEPQNIDEKKGFQEYMQTKQVKEQAPNYYDKIRTEETLQAYINRPYKYKNNK